jgi:uncharacterized YigZ family protein
MKFVTKEYILTTEIKKSKFIASIFPYQDFDETMKRLKQEHPKARHHVYAYRHFNEFDQVVENCSDDGEPRGTSGRPSLKVLDGQELINTAVIIVRYFGGIKLGTGGLVRAYSDAVNNVINQSKLYTYKKLESLSLAIEYNQLSQIEYLINNLNILITNKKFESNVILDLEATKEDFIRFNKELPLGLEVIV